MAGNELTSFAKRYAEAWCSHDPDAVVAFYAKNASITVNEGSPAPIAKVAQSFMRDFPDMVVTFDSLEANGNETRFHWTLTGTNAGPGGTGKSVRISGFELWTIDDDGLIGNSRGYFDVVDYRQQLDL